MNKQDINLLEQLLYNTDENDVIIQLGNIDNPLILHFFAANYNWNNGFNVPMAILENENCDLGTGLLMFHYADGYRLLENPDEVLNSSSKEWKNFLSKVYNKLKDLEFKSRNISFDPGLTRVQKFKLKKNKPDIPNIFINSSPGNLVHIPQI
ncbi:DUF4274 domain-containing protein [Lentibacillus sp. L22]|uniref:DUF4274 domain-containing protein n=1 Tax=Lentibacillus TaxID=175304 RepID=UPI0022B159B0|nr:DUF4274 domain-containing protein [Lentibacillus daqui]